MFSWLDYYCYYYGAMHDLGIVSGNMEIGHEDTISRKEGERERKKERGHGVGRYYPIRREDPPLPSPLPHPSTPTTAPANEPKRRHRHATDPTTRTRTSTVNNTTLQYQQHF